MAINKAMRAALKALSYPDIDIKKNYKIERLVANAKSFDPLKPFYKTWDHVVTFENHEIPVRLFLPEESGKYPLLIFFHGGGWVTGNIDSYNRICANMANLTKHLIVSVDYRLAPEYRFPAAPEDCYHVTREVFANLQLFGILKEQITLIGDSAGANLAAAVSLMARDRGEFVPTKQILLYPSTHYDHSSISPFASVKDNGKDYLLTAKKICDYIDLYKSSDEDFRNPYFAPLMAKDFSNQPKTLLITAEYDPLRDEGEEYGLKLLKAGNKVEIHRIKDALHGFFSLPPTFEQVKLCYQIINRFLSEEV